MQTIVHLHYRKKGRPQMAKPNFFLPEIDLRKIVSGVWAIKTDDRKHRSKFFKQQTISPPSSFGLG